MKHIKFEKPKGAIPPEMVTVAVTKKAEYRPSEEKPEKIAVFFKIPGYDELLVKEWRLGLEEKSILRQDASTILGKQLTDDDLARGPGLDPATLADHTVAVVVMHKSSAGGKLTAFIGPIFRVEQLKEMVKGMEE